MRDFHKTGRSAVFADNGMCATSHPLAAQTAVALLQAGGNAVDAAIGAAYLLGICEPQMTGIGGDMFALIAEPDGRVIGLNASGRAPAGLSADQLRAEGLEQIPVHHPGSVTVPGAVDGFCRLHGDHGVLPLEQVLAPAIHYAEAGVPVAPRVAFDWADTTGHLNGNARTRYLIQGRPAKTGERFAAPDQATVLRLIAQHGRSGFYEGAVAEDMVASLQALGGSHTLDDFAAAESTYVDPITSSYRGHELVELPPNGQGATAMLILNILSHFDIAAMDPFGAPRVHLEAEATKLAYGMRNAVIADPDHTARLPQMLSLETAKVLAARIDPNKAMASPPLLPEATHAETVYVTVVDRDRRAVSLIYSIFANFGSGIASDRYGILFHNRGSGFTLAPGHPNEAGPGKRPMHTIIPALLRSAGQIMPFGVMGGQYQATGHGRLVTNLIDFDLSPQAAIDGPRSFTEAGELRLETGYNDTLAAQLSDWGHTVVRPATPIGGAQAIRVDTTTGLLEGGSDPRKDGIALGY